MTEAVDPAARPTARGEEKTYQLAYCCRKVLSIGFDFLYNDEV
jgi:hypothetical protein